MCREAGEGTETWRGGQYMDELAHAVQKAAREVCASLTLRRADGTEMPQAEALALFGDTVKEEVVPNDPGRGEGDGSRPAQSSGAHVVTGAAHPTQRGSGEAS